MTSVVNKITKNITTSRPAANVSKLYIGDEIGYLPKGISQVWVLETKELAAMLTSLKNRFDSA